MLVSRGLIFGVAFVREELILGILRYFRCINQNSCISATEDLKEGHFLLSPREIFTDDYFCKIDIVDGLERCSSSKVRHV